MSNEPWILDEEDTKALLAILAKPAKRYKPRFLDKNGQIKGKVRIRRK